MTNEEAVRLDRQRSALGWPAANYAKEVKAAVHPASFAQAIVAQDFAPAPGGERRFEISIRDLAAPAPPPAFTPPPSPNPNARATRSPLNRLLRPPASPQRSAPRLTRVSVPGPTAASVSQGRKTTPSLRTTVLCRTWPRRSNAADAGIRPSTRNLPSKNEDAPKQEKDVDRTVQTPAARAQGASSRSS
jgi:hypothetical protein